MTSVWTPQGPDRDRGTDPVKDSKSTAQVEHREIAPSAEQKQGQPAERKGFLSRLFRRRQDQDQSTGARSDGAPSPDAVVVEISSAKEKYQPSRLVRLMSRTPERVRPPQKDPFEDGYKLATKVGDVIYSKAGGQGGPQGNVMGGKWVLKAFPEATPEERDDIHKALDRAQQSPGLTEELQGLLQEAKKALAREEDLERVDLGAQGPSRYMDVGDELGVGGIEASRELRERDRGAEPKEERQYSSSLIDRLGEKFILGWGGGPERERVSRKSPGPASSLDVPLPETMDRKARAAAESAAVRAQQMGLPVDEAEKRAREAAENVMRGKEEVKQKAGRAVDDTGEAVSFVGQKTREAADRTSEALSDVRDQAQRFGDRAQDFGARAAAAVKRDDEGYSVEDAKRAAQQMTDETVGRVQDAKDVIRQRMDIPESWTDRLGLTKARQTEEGSVSELEERARALSHQAKEAAGAFKDHVQERADETAREAERLRREMVRRAEQSAEEASKRAGEVKERLEEKNRESIERARQSIGQQESQDESGQGSLAERLASSFAAARQQSEDANTLVENAERKAVELAQQAQETVGAAREEAFRKAQEALETANSLRREATNRARQTASVGESILTAARDKAKEATQQATSIFSTDRGAAQGSSEGEWSSLADMLGISSTARAVRRDEKESSGAAIRQAEQKAADLAQRAREEGEEKKAEAENAAREAAEQVEQVKKEAAKRAEEAGTEMNERTRATVSELSQRARETFESAAKGSQQGTEEITKKVQDALLAAHQVYEQQQQQHSDSENEGARVRAPAPTERGNDKHHRPLTLQELEEIREKLKTKLSVEELREIRERLKIRGAELDKYKPVQVTGGDTGPISVMLGKDPRSPKYWEKRRKAEEGNEERGPTVLEKFKDSFK